MEIILKIPGTPIPLKRHRSHYTGSYIQQYDPQVKEKKIVIAQLKRQFTQPLLLMPLCVDFRFSYAPLKSMSKKIKEYLKTNIIYKDTKSDLSNNLKFFEDCMNEVVYHDDSQIVDLSASKFFSCEAYTLITITPHSSHLSLRKVNPQS